MLKSEKKFLAFFFGKIRGWGEGPPGPFPRSVADCIGWIEVIAGGTVCARVKFWSWFHK